MSHKLVYTSRAFTIIELMVAILVFTVGMLSAYMLVDSAMGAAINGRNEIIATNLAREQIELLKNLRDTNWLQNRNFFGTEATKNNHPNIELDPVGMTDIVPGFYLIENKGGPDTTIYLKKLSGFNWNQDEKPNLSDIQLCLEDGRYVHNCLGGKKSSFYSFVQIQKLNKGEAEGTAYRVTSVVLTLQRGHREYVVRTILTDWKR